MLPNLPALNAPEHLADDTGGSQFGSVALWPWLCAAGKRRRIWQVSVSFSQRPVPATAQNARPISVQSTERFLTQQKEPPRTAVSPSSCISVPSSAFSHPSICPLHIHFVSFHQRSIGCSVVCGFHHTPKPLRVHYMWVFSLVI